jgi:hypothetical protein
MAAPPGPVKVNVEEVIVAAFIARLKVAVRVVLTATPAAPLAGVTELTVGPVGAVDVPKFDPPHAERTRGIDPKSKAIPKRTAGFPLPLQRTEGLDDSTDDQRWTNKRVLLNKFRRADLHPPVIWEAEAQNRVGRFSPMPISYFDAIVNQFIKPLQHKSFGIQESSAHKDQTL